MIMKTLLVESDPQIRQELHNIMAFYPMVQIVGEVDTTEQAFQYLHKQPVNLVLCNIQPAPAEITGDGCHLIASLAEFYPDIQTVLYMQNREDMQRLTQVSGAGFLQYPFDRYAIQRIMRRIDYIFELQQYKLQATNRHIMVKTKEGYQRLALDDILFIERVNRRNMIITKDGRTINLFRYTMEELEAMFSGSGFYRCYQSFIVNISKVAGVYADSEKKTYTIRFKDYDGDIMLSRDKYSEFVTLLQQRFSNINL